MTFAVRTLGVLAALILLVSAGFYVWLSSEGLSARRKPTDLEYAVANRALGISIPAKARKLANPVTDSETSRLHARQLYSDNCSVCHGIDGKGVTNTAKGLSPEVPDLHADHVQALTDGELFYIIRNGVRFTGMPAWDFRDDEVWNLVSLIRDFRKKTRPDAR